MIDFIELTPVEKKKYCLVIVDMFSKWVEAFPVQHATAQTVAKILLRDIICRWGAPRKISSENGAHFANQILTPISEMVNINLVKHCSYHPQSGGAVERDNGTLKNKLSKICEEIGLNWVQALPLALIYMRMRHRQRNSLSTFEILFAGPPNMGMGPPNHPGEDTTLCDEKCLTTVFPLQNN